ncbi:MAG: DUF58 domain-containing protein [Chitinophagaceae bacterium]|nr:DUF58 domain-containing protein [Chitinophagaceae bacterium]MCB9045848.1 DUF58 domain-containing protein [Chitinophagales bacterium]
MSWKKTKWLFRYYAQYFPFTINTLFCVVAAYFSYRLLYSPASDTDPEAFRPFIMLMGKMVFWFIIVLICASVLSTLISWLYYMWLYKKGKARLELNFVTKTAEGKKNKLYMDALLYSAKRPLLGFIKGRLFYDDHHMTDKFSLLSNKRKENSIWPVAVTGRNRMELPDIKEYELRGGFIYFHDMLHLFSLAVHQPVKGQFHQPPVLRKKEDKDVAPKKTENTDVRIDQLRRVEGEYLNYKDFEAGDDVRRIVWKVYAKNRELVVRIPERFEPFASHLYFYASFYAPVKTQWIGDGYMKEMLNYYKNNIWTVYDTLAAKEWAMRYIPDQSFNLPEHLTDAERSSRIISNSSWHKDKSLQEYFNPKQGTVLCISSFTDPHELDNLLSECNESTVVYFVKLSRTFKHFVALNWIRRIIFLPPKDRLNKLRTTWTFSPARFRIQKREKELEEVIKRSGVTTATL